MKYILSILFLAYSTLGSAQNKPFYKAYDWDAPSYPSDSYEGEDIVGLKDLIVSEFFFTKKNNLVEYYMEHEKLLLLSDDQIEQYNKVYLPYTDRQSIMLNKARVINKDGSVTEVPEDKIFEATDEETGRTYQYFALEGIEKGSILERIYVYQRYPEYNGKYLRFQEDYDKYNVDFNLLAPKNLIFKFKSYNGLSHAKSLEKNNVNHWQIKEDFIEGIDREAGASYDASTQHIVYKLNENTSNTTARFADYSTAAKNIEKNLRPELSRRESKAVNSFAQKAIKGDDANEKLRTLDNYIKDNFLKAKGNDDKHEDIRSILDTKIANNTGLLKLYLAILKTNEIPHELVLTNSRMSNKFDPSFEAYNFLEEYLIYFPDTDKYTSPTDFSSRYGFPDGYLTDNYGLFMKEVKVGNFTSMVAEIRYIDAVKAKETLDKMRLDVTFDENDLSLIKTKLDNELTGYSAVFIQNFFPRMDKDARDNLLNSYANRLTEDMVISKKEALNVEKGMFGKEPLFMNYEFTSKDFVEKAGNRRLFKLGKLIGTQTELYQEKVRKLPYNNVNNRFYDRMITVHIPNGYTVANLDDIKIDNQFKNKKGDVVFYFKSDYDLDGNILTVTANEYYEQTVILPENYEEFRTVINSAADFEKTTLVLQPE
ncbi:MAG: DUF3857 domain-containing protein [Nonlabens sp.]